MEQSSTQTQPIENKLLSNVLLETKEPVNRSWAEDVEEYEHELMEALSSEDENDIAMLSQTKMVANIDAKNFAGMPHDEYILKVEKADVIEKPAASEREIVLKFIDTSNEEKYERLIKEEKLKTPLKRRCSSSTSRSNSPLDGESSGGTSITSEESNHRFFSKKSKVADGKIKNREYETSEEILSRRQKQIEYGKNTIGYDLYLQQVPRNERTSEHPWTPPKNHKYSRRAFDGMIKVWRKKLHCYDPNAKKEDDAAPAGIKEE